MKYKYYSTQRPIDIGTYPKPPEAPEVELVFYDQRKPVENGTALAWGELIYDAPLTPEQVSGYELRPSRDRITWISESAWASRPRPWARGKNGTIFRKKNA